MTAPELRPGGGREARRPVGPDVLSALLRAQQAVSRTQAAAHILDAMAAGLHLADANKALAEWDANNPTQTIPARFDERCDPSPEPIDRRIS